MKTVKYDVRDTNMPEALRERLSGFRSRNHLPPGWKNFVCLLDKELKEICPDYKLAQVKSKYGSLRYYVRDVPEDVEEEVTKIISKYEQISAHICEVCGQEGKKITDKWRVIVRCDKHKE